MSSNLSKALDLLDTLISRAMTEEKKEDIEKAVGFDKQSTLKLITQFKDADSKQQTNESNIPQVGLGTWKSALNKVTAAVEYALKAGYKHIDCAHCYGNEQEIGAALNKSFKNGVVKREDIFITSKLWNTDHHPDDVPAALEQTLNNLQIQYLDLYLMHWPYNFKRTRADFNAAVAKLDPNDKDYSDKMSKLQSQLRFPKDKDGVFVYGDVVPFMDTWRAMEQLVISGKVKHIGLSNFSLSQVNEVLKGSRIKPAMLQLECHPYLNQNELITFCHKNGMQFTCYSPLGSPSRPNQNHYYPILMEDKAVNGIMNKFKDKTCAHVLIRFQIDRKVCVIPKSVTPSRIKTNLEVFDMKLSEDDMKTLLDLNRNLRYCCPTAILDDGAVVYRDRNHPNFPFVGETVKTEKDFKN